MGRSFKDEAECAPGMQLRGVGAFKNVLGVLRRPLKKSTEGGEEKKHPSKKTPCSTLRILSLSRGD